MSQTGKVLCKGGDFSSIIMEDNTIVVRDIKDEDDLSKLPELIADAFQGALDIVGATWFVQNCRKDGIIAIAQSGEIIGANFLSTKEDSTRGIGPIAVQRGSYQGMGLGRRLMEYAIDRAKREGATRLTLVQDASNTLTLALYIKLGFKVKTHLGEFSGLIQSPPAVSDVKYVIRPLAIDDVSKVSKLWHDTCGYSRDSALVQSAAADHSQSPFTALPFVVLEGDAIVGFTLGLNFVSVTLTKDLDVFKALIRYVSNNCQNDPHDVPNFLISVEEQPDAVAWLLSEKLRLMKTYNLMVYKESHYSAPPNGSIFIVGGGGN